MFLLWLRQLPWCGDRTPASVPQPAQGRFSPSNTAVFPRSSFILLSFAWFYIFFSTGQVLLFALIWCSVCTSVSEGIFLMHPWRDVLHVHLLLHHLVLPVFWHMYICSVFFFLILLIFGWAFFVFIAVHGFLVLRAGTSLHCSSWASHCDGFSCRKHRL